MEKKKETEELKTKDKSGKKSSHDPDRMERKRTAGFYKEESSENESESESRPSRNKRQKVRNESEFEEESEIEESEEAGEESEEEDAEIEDEDTRWDSSCYVCKKLGELIC